MRRSLLVAALALCLLLSGCADWMDGSYVSVTPHVDERAGGQDILSVRSYEELRDALVALVHDGAQSATIAVDALEQSQLERSMTQAIRYVTMLDPIGAYSVEQIDYELGTSGGVSAVALNIAYRHNLTEIRRIKQVSGMEKAWETIDSALAHCDAGTVLLVDGYVTEDFEQKIQDYSEQNPDQIMEIPAISVTTYPSSGTKRVLEVKFTYQTNREALRTMQSSVQSVFASARLYVSGDAESSEKYTQLFSFLMNRFDYQIETSITAPYSLLCHGVGDSKAFALCYAAMCRQVGLECQTVSGTRAAEPWFWNIVCIDGVYYHFDLLASAEGERPRFRTDEEMSGYVWDYSAYPACGVIQTSSEQETAPSGQFAEQTQPPAEEQTPATGETAEP